MDRLNDFYVALFSNSSANEFKNSQSAFTNQLAQACELDKSWVVGLTEIAFNQTSIQPQPLPHKRPRRELTHSSASVQPQSKPKIKIHLNGANSTEQIVLSQDDLKKFEYRKGHMNFGELLQELPKYITPTDDHFKTQTKIAIFEKLRTTDWENLATTTLRADPNEFIVHIYTGSPDGNPATLKYTTHNSVGDFFQQIITQMPKAKRKNKEALLSLFNDYFYPTLDLLAVPDKISKVLRIGFNEYGAELIFDTKAIDDDSTMKKIIELDEFIKSFKANVNLSKINDKKGGFNDAEVKKLRTTLKNAVLDVLRGNNLAQPQKIKNPGPNDRILRIPLTVESYDDESKHFPLTLEIKDYKRIDDFLNGLYTQIPVVQRDRNTFIQILDGIFEDLTVDATKNIVNPVAAPTPPPPLPSISTPEIVTTALQPNDPAPPHTFLFVYSDIIRPRLIGGEIVRCLRVIPISENTQHIRFTHIEYLPIERTSIENISILITNLHGTAVTFQEKDIPTFMMLHFKKK